MVTLENKAEMLAAQLCQRIGVQCGNILTGDAIGAAGGLSRQPRIFIRVDLPEPGSANNRYHLTGINIEGDAPSAPQPAHHRQDSCDEYPLIRAKASLCSSLVWL